MNQPQLDPDEFAAWLRSQPPEAEVGMACEPLNCPIAIFVKQRLLAPDPCVGIWEWSPNAGPRGQGGDWYDLPPWAEEFVFQIDHDQDEIDSITARQALSVLREARDTTDTSNGS